MEPMGSFIGVGEKVGVCSDSQWFSIRSTDEETETPIGAVTHQGSHF
jgi:hypothetical protein